MSETVRRARLALLLFELTMMLGVPVPRAVTDWRRRRAAVRALRQRTRSLPRRTRAYEQLLSHNPGLGEDWRRSTTITRKLALR